MMNPTYDPIRTGLLLAEPYNDFLSEGGKLWPRVKEVAEQVGLIENLKTVVKTAREKQIQMFIVLHHRWRSGDYQRWKHTDPSQIASSRNQLCAVGSWGGDWGSPVSSALARLAPPRLLGIHINLPAIVPPEAAAVLAAGGPAPAGLSYKERATFDGFSTAAKKGNWSYAVMMGTRPPTIGYAITDSPAGLAAWMLGHPGFTKWTYDTSDLEKSPDEVLDEISLCWLTNTATSAGRLYWETGGASPAFAAAQKTNEITIPVAITVFPGESYHAPETWARRAFRNLIYFHEVDRGGHFAAWEEPELLASELRAAFRPLH